MVLAAQGKSFCAGANFGDGSTLNKEGQRPGEAMAPIGHLYIQAVRLFRSKKPIVGAIHGAAVGGGLGLSMVPDFRVACPETRFVGNFTRLGFHPGFGLTDTLPAVIGRQNAAMMFYTSRRVTGEEALAMGLADVLVPQDQVRAAAQKLAAEIAENAPLGVTRDARHDARRPCRPRDEGDRARAGRCRRACARPTTSRKASRRWPSAACRISRGASSASPAYLTANICAHERLSRLGRISIET